jgi:signal transduction histidine kinase
MTQRLFSVPPTSQQTRIAVGAGIVLLAGLGITAPFADTPLPQVGSFIPAVESAVIVTDFITSVLLFSRFRSSRSPALLSLASGYLFTSLIVFSHILTFPGGFSPTGLLGAGVQTAGWLYIFWHFGLATAILSYACLKDQGPDADLGIQASPPCAVGCSIAIVVSIACGLTLLVTVGERVLPPVFQDFVHIAPFARYVLAFNGVVCVTAVTILWTKRRSALDQWLMLVMLALIAEIVSNGLLISARFTLGWYVSRLFAIATSTIVLAVLVQETVLLYERMARSNEALLRERNSKLLSLEALAGAIRHEVAQPLAAIGLDAETVELSLTKVPPRIDEARSSAEQIVAATERAGEIVSDIANLFGRAKREPSSIDANDVALEALRILGKELKDHKVATRIELTSGLPPVMGQRGQLQEVIVNLIRNAIEAMQTVDDGERELKVQTGHDGGAIKITIADTGPGIDPRKPDELFEAFFTTKPDGMGLGLALCRMIIENHEGELSVSPAHPRGAIFQIALPSA